jgi:hypothetical protein
MIAEDLPWLDNQELNQWSYRSDHGGNLRGQDSPNIPSVFIQDLHQRPIENVSEQW